MITGDLSALPAARRAQLIYAQAHDAMSIRLWRAALGEAEPRGPDGGIGTPADMTMESLLSMLDKPHQAAAATRDATGYRPRGNDLPPVLDAAAVGAEAGAIATAAPLRSIATGAIGPALAGGPNRRFGAAFAAAEARTGVPGAALVAIVDAEAARGRDGSWNTHSRNPRSSAAGLGQFLSGTWQNIAQTNGTWLNGVARQRGWLDARARILPGARAELLALRYDPEASIASVADLARYNLDRLDRDGFRVRTDEETLSKTAYLSHHLGLGDTRRFLGRGLDPQRARTLLIAQVGATAAAQRIAQAGDATTAHRQWLLGYIDRRFRPARNTA